MYKIYQISFHDSAFFKVTIYKKKLFSDDEEIINFFPLIEKSDNLQNTIPFAKALLENEILSLPRDIAHRAMAKVRQPWRNKEETSRQGMNFFLRWNLPELLQSVFALIPISRFASFGFILRSWK